MPDDIRLALSFRGHRKRQKLNMILRTSRSATDCLVDLWINTAQNHPDGILEGMDEIDIALDAGWEGDPDEFVQALTKSGFLEKRDDGVFILHDWEDHQPFIASLPERKRIARKAAAARWGKDKDESDHHSQSMRDACPTHAECMHDACTVHAERMHDACMTHAERNAPTPTPIPSPTPKQQPTKHFTELIPQEDVDRLLVLCRKINLKPGGKKFRPERWIQRNIRARPEALINTLKSVLSQWDKGFTKGPEALANHILKIQNQNSNERHFLESDPKKDLETWAGSDQAGALLNQVGFNLQTMH